LKYFSKFYKKLRFHESQKHYPPKYSCALKDLAEYYHLDKLDYDNENNNSNSKSSLNSHFSSKFLEYSPLKNKDDSILNLNQVNKQDFGFLTKTDQDSKAKLSIKVPLRRIRGKSNITPSTTNANVVININKNYNIGVKRISHNTPIFSKYRSKSILNSRGNSYNVDNSFRNQGAKAYGLLLFC